MDRQGKLKHKIDFFQDYYILASNEGNLHSMLFVISALGASFSPSLGYSILYPYREVDVKFQDLHERIELYRGGGGVSP